ncbi:dnaK protein [Tritrichomonas foetus]|uniref:DnaK protein n=1 Tax=Tritrichomonas foetus TaxID=1144522 RepID=A0A1J4KFY7_9EUKA|nr:dnaK protein [Tritrichomonas foetus]|eukprot:OHT09938.1 dnaK protein [Tritrichomonas foetus]
MNNKNPINVNTAAIDFGNQNCVLAIPSQHGIDIILNESSSRSTPTMVTYCENRRYAGEFAQHNQMQYIKSTITQIKRLISLNYESDERKLIEKSIPFKLVKLEDNKTGILIDEKQVLKIEQIIAYLFKSLMNTIQKSNPSVTQLVITASPWWDETQRRTILNAAKIANIKIAGLINSTTAAAISYAKIHSDRLPQNDQRVNIAFIDIGDSAMNIAIASMNQSLIEMKSTQSVNTIGGSEFTEPLVDFLLEKVKEKYNIDPRSNDRAMLRFRKETERIKKILSANSIVMFEIPSLMNDIDVSIPIKRDDYLQLIQPLLNSIPLALEKAIEKANIMKDNIFAVEILGGGSRLPAVKSKIKDFFDMDPLMSLDLDECFAIGAGYYASILDGNNIGLDVHDINPYYISILENSPEIKDDNEEQDIKETMPMELLKEFSSIPSSSKISITTHSNQFYITQNGQYIGELILDNIVSNGPISIEIAYSITKEGVFQIDDIKSIDSNDKIEFHYNSFFQLHEDDAKYYQSIEEAMMKKDIEELHIDNARNDLEGLIYASQNALSPDNIIIFDQNTIEEVKEKIIDVQNWFEENEFERMDLEIYESKVKTLRDLLAPYNENQKILQKNREYLNRIQKEVLDLLQSLKNDQIRNTLPQSIELQHEMEQLASEIENTLKLPVQDLLIFSSEKMDEKMNKLKDKVAAVMEINIPKPTRIKKRVRKTKPRRRQRLMNDDLWAPFSMFGDTWDNPWRNNMWQKPYSKKYDSNSEDNEYEYEYEETEENSLNNQKKEQNKRNEIEQLQLQRQKEEEERRRKAAIEAEKQRYEAEKRRRAEIEAFERKKREEERKKVILEAEKQRIENEKRRKAAIEAAEKKRREEEEKLQEKIRLEAEKRKKAQELQELRTKEAERKARQQSVNDPWVSNTWGSSWGDPWGFDMKPQRRPTNTHGLFSPWAL